MNTRSLISILSLLLLALSVFGKSTPNLRRSLSTEVEIDSFALSAEDDNEKRLLVSLISNYREYFASII